MPKFGNFEDLKNTCKLFKDFNAGEETISYGNDGVAGAFCLYSSSGHLITVTDLEDKFVISYFRPSEGNPVRTECSSLEEVFHCLYDGTFRRGVIDIPADSVSDVAQSETVPVGTEAEAKCEAGTEAKNEAKAKDEAWNGYHINAEADKLFGGDFPGQEIKGDTTKVFVKAPAKPDQFSHNLLENILNIENWAAAQPFFKG